MIDWITTMLLSDERLLQAAHIALAAIAAASLGLIAARLARRTMPLRYGLLLAALCLAAAAPLIAAAAHLTRAGLVQVTLQPVASPAPPAAVPPADVQETMAISPRVGIPPALAEPTPPPAIQPPPPRPWGRILGTWFIAVWVAGTVISLLHLGLGVLRLMRIRRLLVPCDDPRLRRCIQRAAELLGLTSLPRACTCPALPIPMVMGLFRPKLVMPASLLDELTDEQLQAVILHETAHIAHRDIWVGLLQRLAAALFWWCPLVHWLNRRLTYLREQICDNYVMRTQGDGFALAEVLVQLAERIGRLARPRLAVALGIVEPAGDGLEGRVARLLQKECNTMTRMNRTAMMMTALFALLLGGAMLVTQVRAADKPKDAANAKTPELCVRPAKQPGQFDLELRLPGKGSNPRMTVEAGKWGMLEVALDAATQLSFRARVNADKQQVRVSGQVTVAVTGGFQQWILDDEPWPVGEWKALKEKATSQPAAGDPADGRKIAWGERTAELQAGLELTKIESTADNTAITLATHLKGPKGLRLEGARYPTAWKVIFTSREDGSAYHACFVYIELESDFIDLGATGTAVVEHFATYFNRDNKEPKNRNKLPPGRYTVTASYEHAEHAQDKPCPYWHGKIVTGAAEIEIVANTGEAKPAATQPIDQAKAAKADTVVRGVLTPAKTPEQAGWPTYTLTVAACYKAPPDRPVKAGQTITVKTSKEIKGTATFYLVWDDRQGLYRLADPYGDGGVSHVAAAVPLDVFAKIIVPSKGGGAAGPHEVEPWIAKELSARGVPIARAVTPWIRLPEGDANDVAHLWDGNLDGKTYGCPASGCVGKRTGESVTVDLNGFGPVAPEIQGATVPPRRGARGIAVVNDGQAFVALHVAPIGEAATTQPAANIDWGEAVNGLQTRLTAEKDRVKAGEPVRLKLELRNVGAEVKRVDAQQAAVNNPLIVRGPKGEEIPFVAGQVSTASGPCPIEPGGPVVLFDGLDAAGQYPLTAPGVHTFQFRGRKAIAFLGEGETSIPPSNTIRVELVGEPPATAPATRASPAAAAVRVRILSGSDRDPARDAVEEWIAKGLADAGSPVTSALTDWMTLSGNERELYSSMRGGRIIKGRVNDKGEVEITGMKIGQSPRIIGVRSGQKQVVKLTNYPGAGNVFIAVESVAVAAPATAPGAEAKPAGSRESTPVEEIAWGKETNGVVANLRALKTDVQSGKPIEFEIQVKNVSQKDVYLLSGEGGKKMDASCWSFRFDQWEWSTPIPSMFRAPLKPGDTASVRCVVRTTRDDLSPDQKYRHWVEPFRNVKTNAKSVRLPAGNYRVYAKWGFKPEIPGDPGPVETNPIEVRITDDRESKQPALVITDADNGKTVQATVGQEVRVSLKGERKQTGWEVSQGEGEALRPLKAGGTIGRTPIPALEFTPDKEGVDDIGTYTFRYTAAAKGTSTLRFVYVYPGGSQPTRRTATALVREFRVTVEVGTRATRPAAAMLDPDRVKVAPVVLRVLHSGKLGTAKDFVEGAERAAGDYVEIVQVYKNEGPDKELATRRTTMLWHDGRDKLPVGEFTAYLKPHVHEKGPCDYDFIGGKAFDDAKIEGSTKEGISHFREDAAEAPPQAAWTRGRIARIDGNDLTLHVFRGHSGIMRPVKLSDKTVVILEGGKPGTLAELKVGQWIKVTFAEKVTDNNWLNATRIEPSEAPWAEPAAATKPAPRAEDADIAWGEAKAGCRVGLSLMRTELAADQDRLAVTVWYENVGKEMVKVPMHNRADHFKLLFHCRQGNQTAEIYPGPLETDKSTGPYYVELAPGKRVSDTLTLHFAGKRDDRRQNQLPVLGPGETFTLSVTYKEDTTAPNVHPATRTSGAVVVMRAKGSDAPAVKNGLSVIIKPSKARFAPGEALAFDYAFTNVGDKLEYALYNKLFDYMYSDPPTFDAAASISIRNPATGASWQVRCDAEILRTYKEFPTIVLAPGKSYNGTFKFEDCLHFLPKAGQKTIDALPPGKYELTVTWNFPDPGNSKIIWWHGEITANPVAIVIAPSDGPDAAKPAARAEDALDQQIRSGRVVESKPLALGGGLALSCFCQAQATPPTPEKPTPLIVGVRVTNTGTKDVEFQPARLKLMLQWGDGPMQDVGINENGTPRLQPPLVLKPSEKWTWTVADARLSFGGQPVYLAFTGTGYLGGQLFEGELKGKADRIAFAARYEAGRPRSVPCEPVVCRLAEDQETQKGAGQPTALAAERAAKLLGDLKTFTLQLNYSGQQEKPYYHLLLSVSPLPGKDRDNPFYRQARVTEQQARAIIEHLVKDGYFDVAMDGNRDAGPLRPKEPYYSLALRVENDGNPVQFKEWLPLAKPLLYQRLDGLWAMLEGAAVKNMDLLIGRLAGERKDVTTQPAAGGKITEDGARELAKRHLAEKGLDWGEPVKVLPVVSDFKLCYAVPRSELDRGIGQRVVLVTGTGEVRILPRR